jgi:NadR type nicotinamide-nucleotide adenylyltransferase
MKKIAVTGPESTGKSTLCEQLADHYGVTWVPEYAREYLLQHGMEYTYDDLLTIAKGQLALEEKYMTAAAQSLIFIDTDLYVIKVWCEFVFGKCHQWILDRIAEKKYDLYLLCNIDLPWVKDTLREYPDLTPRRQLYHMYKDAMINQATPWIEISGTNEQRLKNAVKVIDGMIAQ